MGFSGSKYKYPVVKHTFDDCVLLSIKLSKLGYGKPQEILDMPLETVLGIVIYENFVSEYEERFIEINKPER